MSFGLSAAAIGAIGTVGGAAVSAYGANKAAKKASQGSTNRVELDPRMQGIIYGDGQRVLRPGVTPLLGTGTEADYRRMLENEHMAKYGVAIPGDQASTDWMTQAIRDRMAQGQQVQMNPDSDFMTDEGITGRITGLLDGAQSPGMAKFGDSMDAYLANWGEDNFARSQHAAQGLQESNITAPQVQAPGQNRLDLTPAFGGMIYDAPGANPYLEGGIQKGINQGKNAFSDMLTDATRTITRDVLPNIRGDAVLNNQFGSNRQGLAESRAVEDMNTQITRALERFGQGATDTAVAARAGAYDTDQNRRLAAMTNLSGQQYGVAGQNAGLQAQTNALNSSNKIAGTGLSSGLLDQAYRFSGDNDSYDMNRLGKVSGMLSPFTGFGAVQQTSQPIYSNTGANLLGGAMMGQYLANGFGGMKLDPNGMGMGQIGSAGGYAGLGLGQYNIPGYGGGGV